MIITKRRITYQDELNEDNQKIIGLLEGFRVPYELCDRLVKSTKIKYITEEGLFKTGGILIKMVFLCTAQWI